MTSAPSLALELQEPQLAKKSVKVQPKKETGKHLGSFALFTLFVWGVAIAYFVILLKIGYAARGHNYKVLSASRIRTPSVPDYSSQPQFPWALIKAATSSG